MALIRKPNVLPYNPVIGAAAASAAGLLTLIWLQWSLLFVGMLVAALAFAAALRFGPMLPAALGAAAALLAGGILYKYGLARLAQVAILAVLIIPTLRAFLLLLTGRAKALLVPLSFVLIAAAIAAATSPSPFTTITHEWPWLAILAGAGCYYASDAAWTPVLARMLNLMVCAVALGAIVQVVFSVHFLDADAGQAAITQFGSQIRANSFLRSTQDCAFVVGLCLVLRYGCAPKTRRGRSAKFIGDAALLAALLVTLTRGAWLAVIAAVACYTLLRPWDRSPPRLVVRRVAPKAALLGAVVTAVAVTTSVTQRLTETGSAEDVSAITKNQVQWPKSMALIWQYPAGVSPFGIGQESGLSHVAQFAVPDNSFLTVGLVGGVAAFVLVAGLQLLLFARAMLARHRRSVAVLVYLTVFGAFLDIQNFSLIQVLYGLAIGFICIHSCQPRLVSSPSSGVLQPARAQPPVNWLRPSTESGAQRSLLAGTPL